MNLTPQQLTRLQVLYKQYEAHCLDVGAAREERLAWASARIGRPIHSFKDLALNEARRLIDTLQGILQVKAPSKTPRKRMSRNAARQAGTSGRHDDAGGEIVMAGENDFARIQREMDRLGWTLETLQRFLRSSRSPLKGREQVRTLAEANKVYWALKHIPARKEQLAG